MSNEITKENLNKILQELGKEYKKMGGKYSPAEIDIVGGAAIIIQHSFRNKSYDIDAVISGSSAVKDAANKIGDKYGLQNGWLNSDFVSTKSYSPKIRQYSVYYKTFANVLEVRILPPEYLVAMKARSMRSYKRDMSDIVGMLSENEQREKQYTLGDIMQAYKNLYDEEPQKQVWEYITKVYNTKNKEQILSNIRKQEQENDEILTSFDQRYPNQLTEENLDTVLKNERTRMNRKSAGNLAPKQDRNTWQPHKTKNYSYDDMER